MEKNTSHMFIFYSCSHIFFQVHFTSLPCDTYHAISVIFVVCIVQNDGEFHLDVCYCAIDYVCNVAQDFGKPTEL